MKVDAVATVKDSVWWLAWRRHGVLMAGVALGLIAGFALEGLGVGTVVLGFLLLGLGVLSGLFFYFAGGLFAVFAAAFYLGNSRGMLSMVVDPEGETAFHLANSMLRVAAAAGFDVVAEGPTPVADVGAVLEALATWWLIGLFAGLAVWTAVAAYVNTSYEKRLDEFKQEVVERGEQLLGSEPFTYVQGVGSTLGVWPAERYRATNVVVGESSIMIHHGSELDLGSGGVDVSNSTKQLYYDQVSSVDYDDPYFRVRMSDGEVVSLHTETKPVDLMNLIVRGLQRYKSTGERRHEEDVIGVVEVGSSPDDQPLDEGSSEEPMEATGESVDEVDLGDNEIDEDVEEDDGVEASTSSDFGADILDEVNDILDDFEEEGGIPSIDTGAEEGGQADAGGGDEDQQEH